MLLSVIIPTNNCHNILPKAIDSLLSQNFKDFEIIIMDNFSTDGTLKSVEKYKRNDDRIRLYSEKDEGIYDAMNKGIALAKGEWVYFMGADDTIFEENVLTSMSGFLRGNNTLIYGDCMWMPENIKESGEWTFERFIKANLNHQRIFYQKSLFEKFGNFNGKYKVAADHELNIRFFCNDSIVKKYVPVIIANYHSGGLSSRVTDTVFIEDWKSIFLKNFRAHLPIKTIYGSAGTYIRHQIDKRNYGRAIGMISRHFYYTKNLGFVKLMLTYFWKNIPSHAS